MNPEVQSDKPDKDKNSEHDTQNQQRIDLVGLELFFSEMKSLTHTSDYALS
jgi:hypothetical protein